MADDGAILIGKSWKPETLLLKLANRHGLVTGATGTGKTVTLQVLAEGFAREGVPVFAADIKGDLSGIAAPGDSKPPFLKRAEEIGVKYEPDQFTTVFWDVFGEQGHPVRATISEMGPLLLARLLDLNETQEGVLNIAFRIADEQKLLLLDLKDLRAILGFIAENAKDLTTKYGNVTSQTVGTIQRALLVLENQKGDLFFGEPALEISDLMRTDRYGRGIVNIMAADKLMANPRLYATFLLWLLSELFEQLPEVGDLDKPKLVFFFDEAHLLFNGAPKALLTAVEQVVRLIRSKGIGVYFVTQNPLDIPETVLAQLGNRVQHALRAFTPRDQKAVKAAAETFRQNPKINTAEAIMHLAVGEALISTLEGRGSPTVVERTLIAPPMAQVGPCSAQIRQQALTESGFKGKYDTMIDRESAYEELMSRKNMAPEGEVVEASTTGGGGILDTIGGWLGGSGAPQQRPKTGPGSRGGALPQSMAEKVLTSAARSAATTIGRQVGTAILRGVLGSMMGGKR
ncbi:helicase HerA-like domain-containing protein [Bosea sp. RAC05]|uniref:helicase HerA-like domain-containing protein n=1 Tax=Bosea sp. RAC05 TaxID=1842539 RepID=UPI00083CE1E2|nr:helicase HerA-like domain-containing protein [Bosea sp. RAC05]AOG04001.1 ftsK/SpoIIIE family protein [Bosea sp. RAC05]